MKTQDVKDFLLQMVGKGPRINKGATGNARRRLRLIFWLVVVMLTITIPLGVLNWAPWLQVPTWVEVNGGALSYGGPWRLSEVLQGLSEFDSDFGCNRDITINSALPTSYSSDGSSVQQTSIEWAFPGEIFFADSHHSRALALHSSAHACIQQIMVEPFAYADGYIIGYEGLAVMVRRRDGLETALRKAEEGFADLVVEYAMPNYEWGESSTQGYENSMCLWISLLGENWREEIPALWSEAQAGNLPNVARRLFGEQLSDQQAILIYIDQFDTAWFGPKVDC